MEQLFGGKVFFSYICAEIIHKKEKAMKKLVFLVLIGIGLLGCATSNNKAHRCIAPLPAGVSVENLADCTVPAAFSVDDFRWMGGNLSMTVYNEDLYDAVEISQLQTGDTIIYEGKPIVVTEKKTANEVLEINGGLENGGAWLRSNGGGTYRASIWDDHSIYTKLGKAELPLAEDFIIIDCGENPTDPNDTISENQKLYLESLAGYKREFTVLNTKVRIEKGLIKEIERKWIP